MALDPRAVKFHTIGNTLAKGQKYNDAIASFKKAIDLEPEYAVALYHLAETYEAKKLEDEAYEAYKKAISLNPSYATQHIDTGLYSLLSGPLGKVVMEYKKAVDDEKEEAEGGEGAPVAEAQGAAAISTPEEGSLVDLATRPAVDKPRGRVGIAPAKLLIEPAMEDISSGVGTVEIVSATVLGEKDIPVQEARVVFRLANADGMDDAFIALTPEKAAEETGPKELRVKTDADGRAAVYFKLSKIVGLDKLEIEVEGLPQQVFEDNAIPTAVERVEISPLDPSYSAAQDVAFTVRAYDGFGNPATGVELAVALLMETPHEWEVVDNDNIKTDAEGFLNRTFTMPTHGHVRCKLEVVCKKSDFSEDVEFTVVPGTASSVMFIPSDSKVAPGENFALKMRLMDEYDNPIDGIPARIALFESTGGEWAIGEPASDVTGADGGITVNVTAPDAENATATFVPESEYLSKEIMAQARAETVPNQGSESALVSAVDGFGGEFDDPPAAREPMELDIEIGSDGLSGLPEIPDDGPPVIDAATMDEGPGELSIGGAAAALEGLDFSEPGVAPINEQPVDVVSEIVRPPDASGGETLDQLGAMLDDDAPEAMEEAAPVPIEAAASSMESEVLLSLARESLTCRAGETAPVSVKATNINGSPASTRVKFEILEVVGAGAEAIMLAPGGIESGRALEVDTDLSGEATANVRTSGVRGGFTVVVSTPGAEKKVEINVAPAEPENIVITAPLLEVSAGASVEITARITDKFDNPIPGEFLVLAIDEYTGVAGSLEEQTEKQTDENGEVRATYASSLNAGDSVTITASNPNVGDFSVQSLVLTTTDGAVADALGLTPEAPPLDEPESVTGEGSQMPAFMEMESGPTALPPEPLPALDFDAAPVAEPTGEAYDDATAAPAMQDPFAPLTTPMEETMSNVDDGFAPPAPPMPGPPPDAPDLAPVLAPEMIAPSDAPEEMPLSDPGDYGDDAPDVPDVPDDDADVDAYLAEEQGENPYAIPEFEITVGKKAVVEMNKIMPKVIMLAVAAGFVLSAGIAFLFVRKSVTYEWYYSQAVKNEIAGQFMDAIRNGEKAHAADPTKAPILRRMANIHIQNSDRAMKQGSPSVADAELDKALQYLEKLRKISPTDTDALYAYGKAFEMKQDYCSAIEPFRKILENEPGYQVAEAKLNSMRDKCRMQKGGKSGRARGRR